MLTELDPFGKKAAVAVTSLLFAAGHIYQGAGAFAVTALIGVFLAWLFLRTRSIHIVGLSHAAYNFLILLAGVVV
jgi:membrane protease YdiL (CAAX protease family)